MNEVDLHIARGMDRISESEFERARDYFDEAIRLDPGSAPAYQGRGLAWQYLKEIGNALADYNEAIRIDPTDARTFMNRGTARDWRGDIEEAIADYSEAIRIDPRGVDPYRYRAGARLKKEDHEGTLRDLDEVLRRAPGDPVAYYRRGEVWIKLGLPDKALFDLNEAIRLDPRMTEALSKRTTLYQERGEHGKAEADADRVRKIHATRAASPGSQKRTLIISIFREHFHPHSMDNLTITERQFPFRVRSDLQRATQSIFTGKTRVTHVCGVRQSYSHEGLDITGLITPNEHSPALSVPLEYEEIDIGEETPIRCPKQALWLLDNDGAKYAVLLCPAGQFGQVTGLKFQVAAVNDDRGTRITQGFFKHLEDSVLQSQSYRGKVLSLDARDMYSGRSSGILVHKLKNVKREEVILPRKTLDLLDRNVLSFSRQRGQLRKFGLSTKKGVLLYGPPGTGKTHTIHYLAGALPGHTTFLITAQQMGLLGEYMTLARLLQPSLVVIEDIDLIARDRERMDSVCSESLLNLLLNEMDGLQMDADVFFLLTTNRPESLERALASRPGRIDQAIEYPLPDDDCREKLVHLYSQGLSLSKKIVQKTVSRTRGVSASFIRELMRRSAQFHLERGGESGKITDVDIDAALNELLVSGGILNRRLLGAEGNGPASEVR